MCGRYGFIPNKDFYERFEIVNRDVEVAPDYNIAPGMSVPVVTSNSPKKIEKMKWGLIPFWAKDQRISYSTINARSEEIENKPAFRKPFRLQRCLIPTSGFFEWRRIKDEGKLHKIPYWIFLKNRRMFGFAGIFDTWKDAEGFEIKSFSIVTTQANSLMKEIHDRMPVILKPEDEDIWLDNQNFDIETLKKIMLPYPSGEIEAYRVADLVNNPKNNSFEVIQKSD